MNRRLFVSSLLAGAFALPRAANAQPGPGPGMGPGPGAGMGRGMGMHRWSRERMFGAPMMTLEERQAHQREMWNAKTVEDRNKIRDAHRKQMLERAQQQKYKVDEKQDDVFTVPEVTK